MPCSFQSNNMSREYTGGAMHLSRLNEHDVRRKANPTGRSNAPRARRRRASGSPSARWSCTGASARRARRSARWPSTPASAARPSTGTSRTRRRCSRPAARTGWPLNPAPDLGALGRDRRSGRAPGDALQELYGYYRSTQQMLANLLRDEALVPRVKRQFASYHHYRGGRCGTSSWPAGGRADAPASGCMRPRGIRSPSPPGARWHGSRDSTTSQAADLMARLGDRS